MQFASWLADAVQSKAPAAVLFVTLAADAKSKDGSFLLAGPESSVAALGQRAAAVLEGKGGGRKGRFQGKAARIDRAEQAAQELEKALAEMPQPGSS